MPRPPMTTAVCSVENCSRKPVAKGICQTHYMRLYRRGDVNYRRPNVVRNFWDRVRKDDAEGCWQWLGQTDKDGYGHITFWNGQGVTNKRAHRHAYESLVGPIPKGMTIDHLCHNRTCVNPTHMEPVSNAVNLQRGHALRGHHINH